MAFTTPPPAGAKLRASVLSSLVTETRPISAEKASATSRNTTVTNTADPDLSIALPASSTWDLTAKLLLSSAANAAGDFKFEWQYPANATLTSTPLALVATLASGTSADVEAGATAPDATSPSSGHAFGCSTNIATALCTGRVTLGATAGNVLIAWSQQNSNGSNTTVNAGSSVTAVRVS